MKTRYYYMDLTIILFMAIMDIRILNILLEHHSNTMNELSFLTVQHFSTYEMYESVD